MSSETPDPAAEAEQTASANEQAVADDGADADSKSQRPPAEWDEIAQRTLALCLRAGLVAFICGLIMWWGYYQDQLGFDGAQLNPDDVAYIEGRQYEVFGKAQYDPMFKYPDMRELYCDHLTQDDRDSQIGSFGTWDSQKTVFRHYKRKWSTGEDYLLEENTSQDDEWTLSAFVVEDKTSYNVRILPQSNEMTRVYFSKTKYVDGGKRREPAGGGRDLPEPAGRFKAYQVSSSPGMSFGATTQYLSEDSIEANFDHFQRELLDRGWRSSDVGLPNTNQQGVRTAVFRRGSSSCMLTVGYASTGQWRSIVSLVVF
ncbi:hypothetical protein ACFL34_05475 [Candidatus Sumerlaeota bacterium]